MGGFYMKMSNVKISTVSKSAYNSRAKEYDETQGCTFNYSSKEDHVYHSVKLPDGAPEEWQDKEKLWNANEKFEADQKTTRHGKQFIIAIPQELTQEQTEKAINEFQDYFAKMGYATQADQHEPDSKRSADEAEKNRHVHILSTARKITNGKFERIKEKKMFANDRDANGKPIYNSDKPDAKDHKEYRQPVLDENGEQKFRERPGKGKEMLWERVRVQDNPLDRKETVEAARAEWAKICNTYLSENQKIDHRSYERQGLDQVAQVHEGVGSHKEHDDRKQYNEDVKRMNAELDRAKREAAERLREKGAQSRDIKQGEAVSGDNNRADNIGGRVEGGDRQERPEDRGHENGSEIRTQLGTPGLQREESGNREIDERLQRVERTDRAETASRRAKPTDERFRGQEKPDLQTAGREQEFESREQQAKGADAERDRKVNVADIAESVAGIREEQQSLESQVQRAFERVGELRQSVRERFRNGIAGVGAKLERGFRTILERSVQKLQRTDETVKPAQPKPEEPKQTTESSMSVLQRAQQMNITQEPRGRSEDMSKGSSLLQQAKEQNQSADRQEKNAEKPENDVMARFRAQKEQTEQNRTGNLQEEKQLNQTAHRRRGR